MKVVDLFKTMFKRAINVILDGSSIIRDLIRAVKGLTDSVRELTKAQIALAKMQIEDRQAITELYNLHADILTQIQKQPAQLPPAPAPKKSTLTPMEQIQAERKKGVLN